MPNQPRAPTPTYFGTLAHASNEALKGPDQQSWLTKLADETDNLRAALSWCATFRRRRRLGHGGRPLALLGDPR